MTPLHHKPSVSRRTALAGLSAAGFGLALAAPARAQEASPEAMADHPLVGTWVIQFEDPSTAPAVAMWGADGSFVDAGSGHTGVWEMTGPRTALHTWVHVFAERSNYVVVSGTITVDDDGNSWTQPYSNMVVGADGTVLHTGTATVHGKRLLPVPEDELDMPIDAVPTWTPAAPEATPPAG